MSSFLQPSNPANPGIIGVPRRPQLPIGLQAPAANPAPPLHPFGVTAQPETHDYFKQMQAHFESPAGQEEAWGGASPAYRQYAQNYATGTSDPLPKPRTVYHADGSVENPPTQDPGYHVYNHVSEMPAQDQAEIHAFRNPAQSPSLHPAFRSAPGDTTGGQLIGDPSKAVPMIGVPARNQAPAIGLRPGGTGFQSVAPTQPLSSHADMRNLMIENLSKQMQSAQGSGDSAALYDLFAQRAALDNGGFAGHAKYMQDKETHAAQLEHLTGARPGGRQLNPDGTLNEDAFRAMANARQGADANQTEDTIQTMRIAKAIEDSRKSSQPIQLNPNDAGKFLALKYPAYQSAWATNPDGSPARDIADVYHHLKVIAPNLVSDPKSDFSTALREVLRQQHGENLQGQLDPGPEPQGMRIMPEWLPDPITGVKDMVNEVVHGYAPRPDARSRYLRMVPARDWFNGVDKTPRLGQ